MILVYYSPANSTSVDTYVCSLSELCGLTKLKLSSDGSAYLPDQWYRIFIPIFYAGFLHIIFNLLLQVTMGSSIERNIGIIKYAIIYISSGIGGFYWVPILLLKGLLQLEPWELYLE